MQIKLFKAVLNLFEGEGTGGEGTATGESTAASVAGKQKGEYSNVVFGIQESAPEEPGMADESGVEDADPQDRKLTPEERAKAYRDFIESNKDLYQADLDEKFKKKTAHKYELENRLKAQQEVIDLMMARHNIQDGDVSKLIEALNNDNAYYERIADERGMTPDQVKMLENLQRQNAQLMRTQQERIEAERAQAAEMQNQMRIQRVIQDAAQVKAMYPQFDLKTELETSPAFRDMIDRGVPPLHAYRIAHFDELQQDTVQATAAQTEKAVTSNIRAKGKRPVENGTTSQASFIVKDDVSKLNKKDRAEIARRALRGERISF